MDTYQKIGYRQVHKHRVYPSAGLASALQDDSEHRDVADGRDDHEYAVRANSHHMALVESHVIREIRLVEHGRVGHVDVGPSLLGRSVDLGVRV